MSYSEKIKDYRKQAGLSQAEMAELIGISQAAYGKIESGFTKSISIDIGKAIAEALNLSFVNLFEIDDIGTLSQNANRIKELQDKVKDLENRLKKEGIIIESLENKIKDNAAKLIENIEEKGSNAAYWYVLQELSYSKSKEKKAELEKLLETIKRQREGIYDFYLKEGIITHEDIQRTQAKIKDRYSKMFQQIYGDPPSHNEKTNP